MKNKELLKEITIGSHDGLFDYILKNDQNVANEMMLTDMLKVIIKRQNLILKLLENTDDKVDINYQLINLL